MIPILKEDLISTPDSGVIPAGIASQETINEQGQIVENNDQHMTHQDQGNQTPQSIVFVTNLNLIQQFLPSVFSEYYT